MRLSNPTVWPSALILAAMLAGCGPESSGDDLGVQGNLENGTSAVRAGDDAAWRANNPVARFGAAGDFGGRDERAGSVMRDVVASDLDGFFVLGDLSYGEITPEQAWCDWVHASLEPSFPFEVMTGNHEDDRQVAGFILNFAGCMPDQLGSQLGPGGYGVNYAADVGPVTVIATSPNLSVGGVFYGYGPGTPERDWLVGQIDAAQRRGEWVVVAMHEVCISMGNKHCEIGTELPQLLIDQGVDLVLQAHDHDYQRSHALASIVEGGVGDVVDSGSDGRYARGAGTVFVIAGMAGRSLAHCSHDGSESGNFAAHWCAEEGRDTKGYVRFHVDRSELRGELVGTAGTPASDSFTIR